MLLVNIDEVRDAVAQTQNRPRVHPNGFIQLDLAEDGSRIATQRLHVWPDGDDIPKQSVSTTVHDHRFDMNSKVLVGTLLQHEYDVEISPQRNHFGQTTFTHEVYVATYPGDRKESVLGPSGVKVRVAHVNRSTIKASEVYYQPRYSFHDTQWQGLTATLMTKGGEDQGYDPRILVPLGEEPDNTFVRADVDLALLWGYIERALSA